MNTIPAFAPGCFGSALAFQATTPTCLACEFAAQCKPLHEINFKRLHGDVVLSKRRKFEMDESTPENPNPGALSLPKKVQEEVDRIDELGLNIRDSLNLGKNPFSASFKKYLYVASHLLMKMQQPLRQEVLCAAYIGRLGYDKISAQALSRQAIQIFRHTGVVDEIDGGFILRRN